MLAFWARLWRLRDALLRRSQVAESTANVKCGYLFKYRPWAEGVFKDPWVRRFFRRAGRRAARKAGRGALTGRPSRSLVGNTLLSYKSEHDAAHLPRSSITLDAGCTVEARPSRGVWQRKAPLP